MEKLRKIEREARWAKTEDRHRDAALLYRQAASLALDLGDRAAWFSNTVNAAIATSFMGERSLALSLLLAARQQEPQGGDGYSWTSRLWVFTILLNVNPDIRRLQAVLEDLRSYPGRCESDLRAKEGDVHRMRWNWIAALVSYEGAYASWEEPSYIIKSSHAYCAAICSLRLGRYSACLEWANAVATADDEFEIYRERCNAAVLLRLAMIQKRSPSELKKHIRKVIDCVMTSDDAAGFADNRDLVVRAWLLVPEEGDPRNSLHPAFAEYRRRIKDPEDLLGRFDKCLLFLDYRIACMRYAVGIAPTDDLYYQSPQIVSGPITLIQGNSFPPRLRKAHIAAQRALCVAERIDTLLECDWRQKEIRGRIERIEEIAKATGHASVCQRV